MHHFLYYSKIYKYKTQNSLPKNNCKSLVFIYIVLECRFQNHSSVYQNKYLIIGKCFMGLCYVKGYVGWIWKRNALETIYI